MLTSAVDKIFSLDVAVPASWNVTKVTGPDGKPLTYETYTAADGPNRLRIRLPQGVPPGQDYRVSLEAVAVPTGWVGGWDSAKAAFPPFSVLGATRDVGAVAVVAGDDMTVRPETTQRLIPLDDQEKNRFGLGGVATNLAFRYEAQPFAASLVAERTKPRLTARSFALFKVETDQLIARYEVQYRVEEARARELSLLVPGDAPTAIDIRGLDGVSIKQFGSKPEGDQRRYTILLAEPRRDLVRLTVEFQKPLSAEQAKKFDLPMIRAADVAYQSGTVAVEGSSELEVQVTTKARTVDVGEMAAADFPPLKCLLGVYGFVGQADAVTVSASRLASLPMYPTLVQRADLLTKLSSDGVAQTSAVYTLQTKQNEIAVLPPAESTKNWQVWSAMVDDRPIKPQRAASHLLLTMPPAAPGAVRKVKLLYESPVSAAMMVGKVDLTAPRMVLPVKDSNDTPVEIPVADLQWKLQLPSGYRVVRNDSTLATEGVASEPPALVVVLVAPFWRAEWPAMSMAAYAPDTTKKSMKSAAPKSADAKSEAFYMQDGVRYEAAAGEKAEDMMQLADESKSMECWIRAQRRTPTGRPSLPAAKAAPAVGRRRSQVGNAARAGGAEGRRVPATRPAAKEAAPPPDTKAPPAETPPPAKTPEPPAAKPAVPPARRLEGVTSLKTDLVASPDRVTQLDFISLGGEPRLSVLLAHRPRWLALGWTLAAAVVLLGVCWTGRPAQQIQARANGRSPGHALAADPLTPSRWRGRAIWSSTPLPHWWCTTSSRPWCAGSSARFAVGRQSQELPPRLPRPPRPPLPPRLPLRPRCWPWPWRPRGRDRRTGTRPR